MSDENVREVMYFILIDTAENLGEIGQAMKDVGDNYER